MPQLIHRVLMNVVQLAGTAYWVIALHQLVFDGVEIVSMNVRFIGFLLLFVGAVMCLMSLVVYEEKNVKKPTVAEGVYWVVNSVCFFLVFLVAALR